MILGIRTYHIKLVCLNDFGFYYVEDDMTTIVLCFRKKKENNQH